MATLYVAEFAGVANVGAPSAGNASTTGFSHIGGTPPLAEQTLSIGVSSVASAAFNAKTRMVRLHCDAVCSVAFSKSPTASATNARLAANQTEYFGVSPGSKVAVIVNV